MELEIDFVANAPFCKHIGDGSESLLWKVVPRNSDGAPLLIIFCPSCQTRYTYLKSQVKCTYRVSTLQKTLEPEEEVPEQKEPVHHEHEFTPYDVDMLRMANVHIKIDVPEDRRK